MSNEMTDKKAELTTADFYSQLVKNPSPKPESDELDGFKSDDGHTSGSHGAHDGEHASHELPHVLQFVGHALKKNHQEDLAAQVKRFENTFYSGIVIAIVVFFVFKAMKSPKTIPGRLQNALEAIVEGLFNFFSTVMGADLARRFLPFLGTLFIFIILNNYMGMVPGMKSPSATPVTTFALALCVFFYVQYVAISENGIKGYLFHLAGEPVSTIQYILIPMILPLHVVGEFIKPLSLGLRLMGNIMGEDILLFVMASIGVMLFSAIHLTEIGGTVFGIGFPLQLPFLFLSFLLGGIQALVFSLLAAIYFVLAMPHDDHAEEAH